MRTHKLLALASLTSLVAASSIACSGGTTTTTDPDVALVYGAPVLLDCGTSSAMHGDVDGDGHEDLVTVCKSGSSSYVMRAYLNGNLDAPVETSVDDTGRLFDVDGDGMKDFVSWKSIYFSLGRGVFSSPTTATIPSGESRFDVDGDGFPDILTYTSNTVTAWSVAANGVVVKLFTVPAVDSWPSYGDLDGDGKVDIFYAKGSSIVARYGKGAGAFGAQQVVVTLDGAISNVRDVDIDGDHRIDLVVGMGASSTLGWELLHNDGSGKLSVVKTIDRASGVNYSFEDATGDGKVDVVLTKDEALGVLPGMGNGSFLDATVITGPWSKAGSVFFADVNGDGKKDLIVPDSSVTVLLRK